MHGKYWKLPVRPPNIALTPPFRRSDTTRDKSPALHGVPRCSTVFRRVQPLRVYSYLDGIWRTSSSKRLKSSVGDSRQAWHFNDAASDQDRLCLAVLLSRVTRIDTEAAMSSRHDRIFRSFVMVNKHAIRLRGGLPPSIEFARRTRHSHRIWSSRCRSRDLRAV